MPNQRVLSHGEIHNAEWYGTFLEDSQEQQLVLAAVVFFYQKNSLLFLNTSNILQGNYFPAKFIMQLAFSPCLFTLPSLTLFYPGMTLKLAQLGWLGPDEPCQAVGLSLCVLPKARAIPVPHHSSSSSVIWGVFSRVCGMSIKLTWQICLCREGRTVLFIAYR